MINFMGYDEKKLVQIVDEWERRKWDVEMLAAKEAKVPTKHIMTRAEAIVKLSEAMIGYHSVEKTIDFYVAAGMLEIKEEKEKPIFEIMCISHISDTHIKIYSNGRVEGIDGTIINRIPEFIKNNS